MESAVVQETQKQIHPSETSEIKPEETIEKSPAPLRLKRRSFKKYHHSQRWTHGHLPVNIHR